MPNITRIGNGLRFDPQDTSPLSGEKGQLYYHNLLGWRYHNGSIEKSLEIIGGDGDANPLESYRVRVKEDCQNPIGVDSSKVISPTNATYGDQSYTIRCDKTKTCTVLGASYTFSGNPSYPVLTGDVIYHPASNEFRRITGQISSTVGILDEPFSSDFTSAPVLISQAIYSVEMFTYGDATEQTRVIDYFNTPITKCNLAYLDSADSDAIPDFTGTAAVVAGVTNYTAPIPAPSNRYVLHTRPTVPNSVPDILLPTTLAGLQLIFFASYSNSNVVDSATFFGFDLNFVERAGLSPSAFADSAFCFSNSTGTPIGCTNPIVVGGKTRVKLNWVYSPAVGDGTTIGQIEVRVDGKVLPRYVAGTTLSTYWRPVSGTYDTIEFSQDYSAFAYPIEIRRVQSNQDYYLLPNNNSINSIKLDAITSTIIGPAAYVLAGIASMSTLSTVSTASRATILPGTYTETVTWAANSATLDTKGEVIIVGNFTISGSYCSFKGLNITGNLTIAGSYNSIQDVNVTGNIIFSAASSKNWLNGRITGGTVTDNGTNNYYTVIS